MSACEFVWVSSFDNRRIKVTVDVLGRVCVIGARRVTVKVPYRIDDHDNIEYQSAGEPCDEALEVELEAQFGGGYRIELSSDLWKHHEAPLLLMVPEAETPVSGNDGEIHASRSLVIKAAAGDDPESSTTELLRKRLPIRTSAL